MTTNQYPNFTAQIWSQKINAGLDTSCVMLQCVNRDYQADANKGAETINIVNPGKVSANPYSGTISTYETVEGSALKLNLDQHIYFGFQVPDIDAAQTNVNIIDSLTAQAKKSIERKIDQYLFSLHADVAEENQVSDPELPTSLVAGNVYSQFVALAKTLKVAGALDSTNTGWVVVHPDVEEVLLLSEEFRGPSTIGDKSVCTGSIGKIAGLDVFVSNNVGKIDGNYVVLAGTKAAITYASQLEKIETIRAQESFNSIVRGLYSFGALTLNPDAMATMVCTL